MKINIYGGGLSGLTVAYELMDKGHEIYIFEKDTVLGGMCKSKYRDGIPTEHSWRGFGPFYYNMYNLLNRIKTKNQCDIRENFNVYSIDEIKKHNSRDSLWCHYKGNVYDITGFVNNHPGGGIILKAGGNDLETVWKEMGVSWHLENEMVQKKLESMKIGKLGESFTANDRTAKENLRNIDFQLLYKDDKPKNYGKNFTPSDILKIMYELSKFIFSNNRSKGDFIKLIKPQMMKNLSKEAQIYIFDFLSGPGYGFDINTISKGHICLFSYYNIISKLIGNFKWKVTTLPTYESFMEDMVRQLKENNVTIMTEHKLDRIIKKGNVIKSCYVNDKERDADIHVFCIDPFSMGEILKKNNLDHTYYDRLSTVNNQLSFRIGINKNLRLTPSGKQNADGFVLVDSGYNITFYSQTDTWCTKKYVDKKTGVVTLWSGTIIQPFRRGHLYKKSALSLTPDKLKDEIINDFVNSKDLCDLIEKLNNGHQFSKDDITWFEIYDDWYYDEKMGRLTSKNKKWVNNIYNENYRPDIKTQYDNMYIGGAHTKTSVNIWSMEGAVESGKMIARDILGKRGNSVKIYKHKKDPFSKLISCFDDALYYFGLPHIIDIIIVIILFVIMFKILRITKK